MPVELDKQMMVLLLFMKLIMRSSMLQTRSTSMVEHMALAEVFSLAEMVHTILTSIRACSTLIAV
jgi:hypothetical protein